MKTEQDLNRDILKITMTIESQFPELSKYIEEMPVKILGTQSPETDIKNLMSYYDTLTAVLKNYAPFHNKITN